MEPVSTTLTVAQILQIACSEFVKSSAGEAAKQMTSAALAKVKQLYQKIRDRLWGNPQAEAAIVAIEQGATTDLEPLTQALRSVMADDPQFAQEVRQLAQQIINIESVEGRNVQNVYGGEAFQVNDPTAPVIQGGTGHQIHITYGSNPPNS
jgi:hypothetical protein